MQYRCVLNFSYLYFISNSFSDQILETKETGGENFDKLD